MNVPIDKSTGTFGLPPSLRIAIAATDIEAIEIYVGPVVTTVKSRTGTVNAAKVRTVKPTKLDENVSLWRHVEANKFAAALFPEFQLWVHVDYGSYRNAWKQLCISKLKPGTILDHLSNRKATRTRGYLHPYIRLAPVSKTVNTNAGHQSGGEGMERKYMKYIQSLPELKRRKLIENMRSHVQYADPMNLTKMLNISPGTHILNGVRDFQNMFYKS